MQTSFYPRSFALQGAERLLDNEDIEEGTVKYLKKTLHLEQVGYRDWITVRAPKDNEVDFSGYRLTAGSPCSRSFVQRLIKAASLCG